MFFSEVEECSNPDCLINLIGYPTSIEKKDAGHTRYSWEMSKTEHRPAHYTPSVVLPASQSVYTSEGVVTVYGTKEYGNKYVGASSETQTCQIWAEFNVEGKKVRLLRRGSDRDCYRLLESRN